MSEHRAVLQKVSTNATNIFNIPLYIHTSNYYLSIWLISKLEIEELLGELGNYHKNETFS